MAGERVYAGVVIQGLCFVTVSYYCLDRYSMGPSAMTYRE